MFVGWEGVGLCSYLLIGFWFLKQSATDAGKKAFITTRIGDFGFTDRHPAAFWTFGSVDFGDIFSKRPPHARGSDGPCRRADRDLPAAFHWRHRQIRAVAAVRLAAGRDGRPHACQRADSRGDDGHRRRLHGCAHESAIFARADRHAGRRHRRRAHRVLCRHDRAGADRHQKSSRLFHRLAARLHVPGPAAWAHTPPAFST